MVLDNGSIDDLGLIGRVIGGGLRVTERTGLSPQGPLYEALDPDGRPVVLLVLPGREAPAVQSLRWAAQIRHPNVAAVYALGDLPGGSTWVTLEKLAGEPLAHLLGERLQLPVGEAVDLAIQIAAGLEASHRVGLVHGNLSPIAILVTRPPFGNLQVKLVGFNVDTDPQATPMLDAATIPYASPERLAGSRPEARDDVYSAGAVLHHLLSGNPPAQDGRLGKVPKITRAVLEKALARDPAARFRTMAEFRVALEALSAVSATPAETVEYRRVLGRAVAAGLVLLVGGALLAPVWRRVEPSRSQASALTRSPEPVGTAPVGSDTAPTAETRQGPMRRPGVRRTDGPTKPRRSTQAGRASPEATARPPQPEPAAAEPSAGRPGESGNAAPEALGYVAQSGSAGVSPDLAETPPAPRPLEPPARVKRPPAPAEPPEPRNELPADQGLRLAIGDITRVGVAESVVEPRMGLLVIQLTPQGMSVPSATYNLQRLYLAYSAALDHPDSVALELRRNRDVYGWVTRWGLRYVSSGEWRD